MKFFALWYGLVISFSFLALAYACLTMRHLIVGTLIIAIAALIAAATIKLYVHGPWLDNALINGIHWLENDSPMDTPKAR